MKTLNCNKPIKVIYVSLILLFSTQAAFAEPVDNAALLYYQAFLSHSKPDNEMSRMLTDFRKGEIEVNEKIRQYVEKSRRAIDLAIKAAEKTNCDWGYDYSKGMDLTMPALAKFRALGPLIVADAKVLAAQGDYKTALERCLTLHKMSRHIVAKPLISYLVGISMSEQANKCTQDILGSIPKDLRMLRSFRDELSQIEDEFPSFKTCVAGETEFMAMQKAKLTAETLSEMLGEIPTSSPVRFLWDRLASADEQFIDRNKKYLLGNYMGGVQAIVDMSMPYAETYKQLKQVSTDVHEDVLENPYATLTAIVQHPFAKIYSIAIRRQNLTQAVMAAIGVYMKWAKTGKLPDELPAGLPKDLFSGEDFQYEKTADGFILRCRGKDLDKDETYEYEFKVKR